MTDARRHSPPYVTLVPGGSVPFAGLAHDCRRSAAGTVWTSKPTLAAYGAARPPNGIDEATVVSCAACA